MPEIQYPSERVLRASIYFFVDELVDKDVLKALAKQENIPIFFHEKDLDGIFSVGVILKSTNIIQDVLDDVRRRLRVPFTEALKKRDKAKDIIKILKDTEYIKNFTALAQQIFQEIKAGKESLQNLEAQLEIHRQVLGETGIKLLVKIFRDSSANAIVENYAKFQELVINKFAYELFLTQQLEHSYLVAVHCPASRLNRQQKVTFQELPSFTFHKLEWNVIFSNRRLTVYTEETHDNILIFEDVDCSKARDFCIYLKLVFLNAVSGLRLIEYSLEQEDIILLKEKRLLPYRTDDIRNRIIQYSSKDMKVVIDKLDLMLNTSNSAMQEFLLPIKATISELLPKRFKYDALLTDRFLKRELKSGGEVYGVEKAALPAPLKVQFPSEIIKHITNKLANREQFYLEYHRILRGLRTEAQGLYESKLTFEKNIEFKDTQILNEKIKRFLDLLESLTSIVSKILKR